MRITFCLGMVGCVAMFSAGASAAELYRRPLGAVAANGWHQVQLDEAAQAAITDAWLGDASGRPVPFLRQSEMAGRRETLPMSRVLSGRDDAGALNVEFRLEATLAPADEMVLTLSLDGTPPWIAQAEIARRQAGGEWLALERVEHLYEFGATERRLELRVPRDATEWRLRIRPVQGEIRRVAHLDAQVASARGEAPEREVLADVTRVKDGWLIEAAAVLRIKAVDLTLDGAVAPVRAEAAVEMQTSSRTPVHRTVGRGLVWRMPGLGSAESTVRFDAPVSAQRLLVQLPAGAEVRSARLRVQEERLWFVAEAGQRYALHFGGEKQAAAGNLRDLPADVWRSAPPVLTLGAPERDPFGRPAAKDAGEALRRWLPWVIGALVLLLALVALRLLRQPAAR